jgi:hypothetical protein
MLLISLNRSDTVVRRLFPEDLVEHQLEHVQSWERPGEGKGASFVVDDVLCNGLSMRRFARVLRAWGRELPDVAGYICTSVHAAELAEAWSLQEEIPEEDLEHFREHFVALYTWVPADGVDCFVWSRDGLNRGMVSSIPPGT